MRHVQVMIDDSHLLAASEDRTWTIWDMNTEKLSKIYRAAMGAVRGVAMGPDQVSGSIRKQYCASAWGEQDDAGEIACFSSTLLCMKVELPCMDMLLCICPTSGCGLMHLAACRCLL
jgi:hypothetical protein